MKRNINIILLFLVIVLVDLIAEPAGNIFWVEEPGEKYVNMGPCFIHDSLETTFTLENTGTEQLLIRGVDPTFIIYVSPTEITEDQFREFEGPTNRSLPVTVNAENSVDLKVGFFPFDTSMVYPTGSKAANLNLGFINAVSEELVVQDSFFLKAYKTPYYIWGYEIVKEFDSVYVEPSIPAEKLWKVKSTWKDDITISDQLIEYLSPIISQPEFSAKSFDIDPVFVKKYDVIDWTLNYSPLDMGRDSAVLKLIYSPDKEQFPDSTDYAWVKMRGTGVKHDLRIIDATHDFIGDTVFLGDIIINSEIDIIIQLQNYGNLPIGVINQKVTEIFSDHINNDFSITDRFADHKNLKQNESDIVQLNYLADKPGKITAQLSFETDIKNRNIHGVPASELVHNIIIKANVLSPKLEIPADTIDLGNVIVNSADCPSSTDTLITLRNSGSLNTFITDIKFDPGNVFYVNKSIIEIKPQNSAELQIYFDANGINTSDYEEKLILVYLNGMKTDTAEIIFKARGIPPISANLSIPDIRSVPGRVIELPILLTAEESDTSPAVFAKSFQTELIYDETLLRFRNRSTIGTAVEGAIVNIVEKERSILTLNIDKSPDQFLSRDTLIKLYFDTYLGESVSTPISFVESKTFLSDDNCLKAVNIDGRIKSGIFSLDSICGLEYKAVPRNGSIFTFDNIFPQPAEKELNITYNIPFKTDLTIVIIDSYGKEVKLIEENNLPSGKYTAKINVSDLNSGAYTINFKAGLFHSNQTFIISR